MEPDLRGYGWFFPKGDFINVGIGITGGNDGSLPRRRDALLAMLRATGRLPEAMPLDPFKGHAYVVRRQAPRRLAGPGFCLVGDAAGLARDLSGEGIGPPSAAASSPPGGAASPPWGDSLERYAREVVASTPRRAQLDRRQIGRLPEVMRGWRCAGAGSERARRRVVFDSIFA